MARLRPSWQILVFAVLLGASTPGWLSVSDATVVIEMYTVKHGDTLERVASKYGLSVDSLRQKNGFAADRKIRPGESLVVPVSDKARAKLEADALKVAAASTQLSAATTSTSDTTARQLAGRLLVSEVYYVKTGDTLDSIAKHYNVPAQSILEKNRLQPDSPLQNGQLLTIPVKESVLYKSDSASESAAEETPADAAPARTAKRSTKTSDGKVVGTLGVIGSSGAHIRKFANPTSRTVFVCPKGTQLVIVNEKDDWYGVMMIDGSTCWVPKKYVQSLDVELVAGKSDPGSAANGNWDVVREAYRYMGIPYVYGGTSLGGMDCSAFVRRVFASRGFSLPRTAAAQFNVGSQVGYEQLQPGDRLYFSGNRYRVDHTALYIGNGQMIHASGRARCVTVDNFFTSRYWSTFVGARRSSN